MTITRKTLVLLLATTALTANLLAANALADETLNQAANPSGKLTAVEGHVLVNGQVVRQGATINSGSTVTTAARSSAVVSLGKLGRVEVFPTSELKLTFAAAEVEVAMLEAGRVRLSSSSNVTARVLTRNGEIQAADNRRNEFIVDTSCGNTFVSVHKGAVELRAGNTVKQIAAGNQDQAGTARPGCTPQP